MIYVREIIMVEKSRALQLAALLHVLSAIALFVHLLLPRRWLVQFTDELADSAGRDKAKDKPPDADDEGPEEAH